MEKAEVEMEDSRRSLENTTTSVNRRRTVFYFWRSQK